MTGSKRTALTILVTGGTSGIGRAVAEALAAKGCTVLATSRNPDRISPADRLPGVNYLPLDLADPDGPDRLAAELGTPLVVKPATGGSSLGLSIVEAIVTEHGGTIDVQSREGEGATFRIDLPAVRGGNGSGSGPAGA